MTQTATIERKYAPASEDHELTYLSVCSGIEAASAAWHPLGWQPAGFSEIEPFPSAVLAHHYPRVTNYGDLTQWESWNVPAFDVLVGGTPCQGFSVAGKRGGMDDPRSQLVWHFLEIARKHRPRWVLWENVPGVLSSDGGKDFGAVLHGMGERGYGFAYRVLDAQYFGVAQRRRRVFVVGYLGDWRPAAAVLLERESMQGNPAPSREAGKSSAHPVSPCIGGSGRGFGRTGETRGQDPVVAHALKAEGHDASEDGTGRGVPLVPDTSPALKSRDHKGPSSDGDGDGDGAPLVPVSFKIGQGAKARSIGYAEEQAPTLGSHQSGTQQSPGVMEKRGVRRLTPRECERLQGFPDDYTQVEYRGKPAADGPRYKALGNSMAVPCMRWLAERIAAVEAMVRANFTEGA